MPTPSYRRLANVPKLGIIIPEMGTPHTNDRSGLANALFTPVQQRVLGLLFGQPDRRFGSAEIIRLAGSGTGAVHRQLQRLAAAGLVTVARQGNQKSYQANPDSPVYEELHGLAVKTFGLVNPLRDALQPLADRITAAFVYGSVADGRDRADSDIDLMVISDDVSYPEVYEVMAGAEQTLGRPINPTVLSCTEWQRRNDTGDSFAARLADRPTLIVLGDEDALA